MSKTMEQAQPIKRGPILQKPEVLAPAGNLEKLKVAIHYGADAVYIGGQQFSLRANADNFSFEEMREGAEYVHAHNAKIYVAANIIAHNEDMKEVEAYFAKLYEVGIDAVIVADPALIESCKRGAPHLEIHLSTQASTTNWQSVKFWKEEGIARVVLAREVSFEEIREIKKNVDVEIEQFIHGAMCPAYSGRCVLSNHMTARDSNRGGCCHSCRWSYDMFEDPLQQATEEEFPLFTEGEAPFSFSSKDLSMIEHIPEIVESGIDSLKIEGRMKSIHYVATVVNAYRQAIDAYCADPDGYQLKKEWLEEVHKATHRSTTTGFFFDTPSAVDHLYQEAEVLAESEFAGIVLDYDAEHSIASIEQRNHFAVGQTVEFFGPNGLFFRQTAQQMWDEKGNKIDRAPHPLMVVNLKVDHPVSPLDIMRKLEDKS
ncbi:protease [Ammoniphilus oxalaticus]|uniref:Protease n=1 Tax=Ammoniphilus oxalaticus TaxID=66863 RepID=A0A419SJ57_9BACL|nr:U32 family peptidase [Ammoniphilus oxalaticus]RKD23948.1 protease [Ammoniphilus oxalaticus]